MIIETSVINALSTIASKECGRYAINGIHLKRLNPKKIRAAATDGRKLLIIEVEELDGADAVFEQKGAKIAQTQDFEMIVPSKPIRQAAGLAKRRAVTGKDTTTVRRLHVEENATQLVARSLSDEDAAVVISSLPIEGIFPKVEKIIPPDADGQSYSVNHLIALLRAMQMVFASGDAVRDAVKLHMPKKKGDAMKLTAKCGRLSMTGALMPVSEPND